jgi:hypothetical protein
MMFQCRNCGRILVVPDAEVRVGRFLGVRSCTVPPHDEDTGRCPRSGKIYAEGFDGAAGRRPIDN